MKPYKTFSQSSCTGGIMGCRWTQCYWGRPSTGLYITTRHVLLRLLAHL